MLHDQMIATGTCNLVVMFGNDFDRGELILWQGLAGPRQFRLSLLLDHLGRYDQQRLH